MDLVFNTHKVAEPFLPSDPEDLVPSSDLHRPRACTWHTNTQADIAFIHKTNQ